jgi:hypothetical protein
MNFRNKWLVGTVRILLGIMLLGIGGSGLYFILSGNMPEVPGKTEAVIAAEAGLMAAGVLVFAKVVELIGGVLLLANFRPAFAALLLAPIAVGVLLYDLVLWSHAPGAIVFAGVFFVLNAYLGYVYWDKYKAIFTK